MRYTSGTEFTPRPQWDRMSQMDFRPKEDTKASGRYPDLMWILGLGKNRP